MAVVDGETVDVEDGPHLALHRLPDGLDSQHGKDLANVVRTSSDGVHITLRQDAHQRCAVSFQKPLCKEEFQMEMTWIRRFLQGTKNFLLKYPG